MSDNITLSVIIPVYNGSSTLTKCLQSIVDSTPNNIEIIVSDDASSDDSRAIARQFQVQLLVSDSEKPCGAAAARNRAARKARGKYLFFTDSDVVIGSDTLDNVISFLDSEPSIHAVIGSYTAETPIRNFSSRFKNYLHHVTHQQAEEKAITFWTACGCVRREVFLSAGGFNESYDTASVEDIAFGYKLTKQGYRIQLLKDLQVAHLKHYTLKSLIVSDIFYRAIPWTRLMLRERTFRSDLNTSVSSAFGLLATYLLLPSFLAILFSSVFIILSIILLMIFLWANYRLFSIIFRTAGFYFLLRFIIMSYLYYFYSGIGLILAFVGYIVGRRY